MKKGKLPFLVLFGLLLVFGLSGCSLFNTNPPKLEIEEWELITAWHREISHTVLRRGVRGTATNVGGDIPDTGYCEIEAKFYSSDDVLLDGRSTSIHNLDSGETWQFEIVAYVDYTKVDHASVEVGEGFNCG